MNILSCEQLFRPRPKQDYSFKKKAKHSACSIIPEQSDNEKKKLDNGAGKCKSQSTQLNKGHDFNCTFQFTAFGRSTRFILLGNEQRKGTD